MIASALQLHSTIGKIHTQYTNLGPFAGDTEAGRQQYFDYNPSREGEKIPTYVADIWGAVMRIIFNTDVIGESETC